MVLQCELRHGRSLSLVRRVGVLPVGRIVDDLELGDRVGERCDLLSGRLLSGRRLGLGELGVVIVIIIVAIVIAIAIVIVIVTIIIIILINNIFSTTSSSSSSPSSS